ncbi:beta strand repeat-containing protein, partial [Mesoflavibacter profundi]
MKKITFPTRLKKLLFFCLLISTTSLTFAQVTGTWTTSGPSGEWQAQAGNVWVRVINVSGGNSITSAETMGCPGNYSDPAVDLNPSLRALANTPTAGNFTFGFFDGPASTTPVVINDPIIHLDRLGGSLDPDTGGPQPNLSNSVLLTLVGGNTFTELSENGVHFEVSSNTVNRTVGTTFTSGSTAECGTASGAGAGTAAGSVRANGTFTTISLNTSQAPGNPPAYDGGDAIEFVFTGINVFINAEQDSGYVTEGIGGVAVANVLANDTYNTSAPTTANVNLSEVSSSNAGISLNTTTGEINVAPTVPAGIYTLEYQICETAVPTNCDTALTTIIVNPDSDGDGLADDVDLDDDNDGITDIEEGCSTTATLVAPSNALADDMETGSALFPLDPPGPGVLPAGGVNMTTIAGDTSPGSPPGATGNQWQIFSPPVASGNIVIQGESVSFATPYLDLIGAGSNELERIVELDFGDTAENISTINHTYTFVVGIAGLADPGVEGAVISSVPLTVIGNVDVFSTGVFSLFDGATPPNQGANGTTLSTNPPGGGGGPPNGYTFFYVPRNVSIFTLETLGTDQYGFIFGAVTTNCLDFDGDGIVNSLDSDSDNDGIYDVIESGGADTNNDGFADDDDNNADNTASNGVPTSAGAGNTPTETTPGTPDYLNLDSDGDGCSDANEAYNNNTVDGGDTGVYGTDPATVNPDGTVTTAAYNTGAVAAVTTPDTDLDGDGLVGACDLDDDGDGNPNTTDPVTGTPTAAPDSDNATAGIPATIQILSNDDYLNDGDPNNLGTTTITDAGTGSASGTISFDPTTGELIYTPIFAEGGSTVTVDYTVCNDASGSPICSTETVTITVAFGDQDGDGIADDLDQCPGYDDTEDVDGDGIADGCDLDDDNDGIADTTECSNLLTNSGFNNFTGLAFGNNIGVNIAPWVLGGGDQANVVRVDGAGGYDYANGGPFEDANDLTGDGDDQFYLDIVGTNDFYQVINISAPGSISFGGYFSSRDGLSGTAQLRMFTGNTGATGTLVADSGIINIVPLAGDSQNSPWEFYYEQVFLPAGVYSFVVSMDNDANFDEGFAIFCVDSDNDGLPDNLDLDSDNDGIYDSVEAGSTDNNLDGIADGLDTDNNGIPDTAGAGVIPIETTPGTPDYLNLDSDGDGCSDANEAFGDPNADGGDGGSYGTGEPQLAVNPNGTVTSADYSTGTNSDVVTVGPDPDSDGIANTCDLDDDGDGNPDV